MAEWHDIRDPADPELDRLAERYHIHPLHVEDCRHRNQSAKVEESTGYLFAVLKPIDTAESGLDDADLDVFLGRDFVITVRERDCPQVAKTLDPLRALALGLRADQLFYRIIDGMVDSYLPFLDSIDDTIDHLEDDVLERPSPAALAQIFDTKRDLIRLRRILVNTRDVAGHLQRTECDLIARDLWPFLRDVYDHVARNLDRVEMQRDLLTGALDVYLSSVANRTNNTVKALTVIGTVTLPVLLISSIYGMNIKGLPWADSAYAAPVLSAVTVAVSAGFWYFLKRSGWF